MYRANSENKAGWFLLDQALLLRDQSFVNIVLTFYVKWCLMWILKAYLSWDI